MTYIIPSQTDKKFTQTNRGDLSGNIFVTKNINFDQEGYIKLSHAAVTQYSEDNDAAFDTTDALFTSDDGVWFISDELFRVAQIGVSDFTNRSADTNSPSPGVEEDGIYFNDTEVVTDGSVVKYLSSASTWTSVSVSFGSGAKVLTVWHNANTLVTGNNNTVKFINTSWAINGTVLTLPTEFKVTSLVANGDALYIATRHKGNGKAQLFVLNSIKTTYDGAYPIGSFEIFSIKSFGSSIIALTSLGQLLRFNGGGFDELAVLPSYIKDSEWADSQNDYSKLSNRGLIVDGDVAYLALDSSNESSRPKYDNYFPGGIHCYDPKVGIYNRITPSFTKFKQTATIATGSVNTTTDVITVASGDFTNAITGTPIVYKRVSGTVLAGLRENTLYYVIKLSATTIALATTQANAIAGTRVDLTGTGDSSQVFYLFLVNDYGWSYSDNRSAIGILTSTTTDMEVSDRLVFTAELFNNSVDRTVANYLNPLIPNRGYFLTPRLSSSSIEDVYDCCLIKYKPLKEEDSLVIKYRTTDKIGFPVNLIDENTDNWQATWSNTTTFTVVANTDGTTRDLSMVSVGDEIEIVSGKGAGTLTHVTAIALSTGTWTVTVDEAFIFAVAADKFYFVVDNWKKLATVTKANSLGKNYYRQVIDDAKSKFIQFKVELRGVDVVIEEMQVGNATHIPLN